MDKNNFTSISLQEEMQRSYLEYAMSVIVGRALPDARDGLKPVQRRILHSMKDLDDLPKLPELPDPIDISPELALEVKTDQVDEKEV